MRTYRQLVVIGAALTLTAGTAACKKDPAPVPSTTTAKAEAQPVERKKTAEPVSPKTAAELGAVTTDKPADQKRMPQDSIHAPFAKGGSGAGQLPPGHPPVPGTTAAPARPTAPHATKPAAGVETGVDLPLPLVGSGGKQELDARVKGADDKAAAAIEEAFRKVFTVDRSKRDLAGARKLLEPLLKGPHAATAERILGYVAVSDGFDAKGAMEHYKKAVELDPKYGEAHYALSFMYVMSDKEAGRVHFEKARALGVEDTRGLGGRFYPPKKTD